MARLAKVARRNISLARGIHVSPNSVLPDQRLYKACPSESGTDKFMQRFI
jgi:hypothetical protein